MDLITLFSAICVILIIASLIVICNCDSLEVQSACLVSLLFGIATAVMLGFVNFEAYRKGQADALNGKFEYELSTTKEVVAKAQQCVMAQTTIRK